MFLFLFFFREKVNVNFDVIFIWNFFKKFFKKIKYLWYVWR